MRLQFENRATVRHHVEKMLRIEHVTEPAAVQHDIDAYAHLLPDGTNWKATLFIELADPTERARELPELSRAVHELYLEVPGLGRVRVSANDDLADRHLARPSAVHFLRFQFSAAERAALRGAHAIVLGCTHPAYPFSQLIGASTLGHLVHDFDLAQYFPTELEPCATSMSPR
jgi:hypothetical protein